MSILGLSMLGSKVSGGDHSFVLKVLIVYCIYYVSDSAYLDCGIESALVPFWY
jgi:hypothetical protein